MNMFKPTAAKTPQEYMDLIAEPRKTEFKKLYDFINQTLPGEKPFIISGMIGWVPYHYKTASGREGEWAVILLASQKNYMSIYSCGIKNDLYIPEAHKADLPKASIGKSCIRIKHVDDIDLAVLKEIILDSVKHPMRQAT